jgi:hypothetical protein
MATVKPLLRKQVGPLSRLRRRPDRRPTSFAPRLDLAASCPTRTTDPGRPEWPVSPGGATPRHPHSSAQAMASTAVLAPATTRRSPGVPASPRSSTASCTYRGRRLPFGWPMARRGTRPGRVLPLPRSLRGCARGRRPRPPRDDARARGVRRLPSSSPFPRRSTQWTIGAILPAGWPPGHPPVGMNSAPAVRTASAQIPTHTCRGGHIRATSVPSVRDNSGHERSANAPAQQLASVSIAGRLITPVLSRTEKVISHRASTSTLSTPHKAIRPREPAWISCLPDLLPPPR